MENNFYNEIKSILINARNKVYTTANFAMVEAYWNIGKKSSRNRGQGYRRIRARVNYRIIEANDQGLR